ncbi:DUF6894 family protein [Sphingobium chungangianum]
MKLTVKGGVPHAMRRLHFDLHNGTGFTRDDEGRELAEEADARALAISSIRSILSEEVLMGVVDLTGWIDIRSDSGVQMGRVSFSEAVCLRLAPGDRDGRGSSRQT